MINSIVSVALENAVIQIGTVTYTCPRVNISCQANKCSAHCVDNTTILYKENTKAEYKRYIR